MEASTSSLTTHVRGRWASGLPSDKAGTNNSTVGNLSPTLTLTQEVQNIHTLWGQSVPQTRDATSSCLGRVIRSLWGCHNKSQTTQTISNHSKVSSKHDISVPRIISVHFVNDAKLERRLFIKRNSSNIFISKEIGYYLVLMTPKESSKERRMKSSCMMEVCERPGPGE